MEEVIRVQNLSFSYEKRPVFENVSFTVNRGDFAGVIGPNGSGKSTLFKLLLNLMHPDAGSINLFRQDIQKFKDWSKLGYMAQKNTFSGGFPTSVYEVVSANLYAKTGFLHMLSAAQKDKVAEALRTTGMLPYVKTQIGNLSGGQQQRVYLARVLVNDPEILFLDEPSTGMDTKSEAALYEILHKLNEERNITVVLVTHDITAVTAHVGRLFCMGKESLIEHDVSEGLSQNFLSELYGHNIHIHRHEEEFRQTNAGLN